MMIPAASCSAPRSAARSQFRPTSHRGRPRCSGQTRGGPYSWARYYDPKLARFISEDPISFEGGINLYAYVSGNPVTLADPLGYGAIKVKYRGYPVETPVGKIPLGHGAVIAVDETTGNTRYYEYGRYDSANFGEVRRRPVPNVESGPDGRPTHESLKRVYDFISVNYGRRSPVDADYYDDADYQRVVDFAEGRMHDRNRAAYNLITTNCYTFAREAVEAGLDRPRTLVRPPALLR